LLEVLVLSCLLRLEECERLLKRVNVGHKHFDTLRVNKLVWSVLPLACSSAATLGGRESGPVGGTVRSQRQNDHPIDD
jgi:hypothetical protein